MSKGSDITKKMIKTKQIHHAHYYAQALYELAKENKIVDSILEELEFVEKIFQDHPELFTFFELPFVADKEKHAILEKSFTDILHSIHLNFLKILVVKNHIGMFPKIVHFYHNFADEALGRIRAEVTSVIPLQETQAKEISELLQKHFNRTIVISNKIDPHILGGIIVHAKDLWLDSSISRHLKQVHKKLQTTIAEISPTLSLTDEITFP